MRFDIVLAILSQPLNFAVGINFVQNLKCGTRCFHEQRQAHHNLLWNVESFRNGSANCKSVDRGVPTSSKNETAHPLVLNVEDRCSVSGD